jgi:hypothetical protein
MPTTLVRPFAVLALALVGAGAIIAITGRGGTSSAASTAGARGAAAAVAGVRERGAVLGDHVNDAFLRRVVGAAGVNADAALATAHTAYATRRLAAADAAAGRLHVHATPTFAVFIGRGAAKIVGAGSVPALLPRAT